MHEVSFTYQGKDHSGYIASHTIAHPHFYWLFLTCKDLISEIGDDSVAFIHEEGTLRNCNRISLQHEPLVKIAESLIKNYMDS
jgi:hypothetical protein